MGLVFFLDFGAEIVMACLNKASQRGGGYPADTLVTHGLY